MLAVNAARLPIAVAVACALLLADGAVLDVVDREFCCLGDATLLLCGPDRAAAALAATAANAFPNIS